MSAGIETQHPAVIVPVADGPAAGLRLRYTAVPGKDTVCVTDPGSGDANVATITGLIEFDYPRLVFEPEYFNRLNYDRKSLREIARGHYQDSMCGRSIR
jgi:hypothetical protein